MIKFFRRICALICLLMIGSFMCACSDQSSGDISPSDISSVEVVESSFDAPIFGRAKEYGFVPDDMWDEPNKIITMSDLCILLSNVVEIYEPNKIDKWNELSAIAASDMSSVQVDDAILAIFEAAIAMDIELNEGIGNDPNWESVSTASDWWEGASWDYSNFPNWEEMYIDQHGTEIDILLGAELYCQSHISCVDGSYIFPPKEDWTYDLSKDVTYQDAIRAITVFMESDALILQRDSSFISIHDVGKYDSSIITENLLNKETTLPDVSQSILPSSWCGIGLAARKDAERAYRDFRESDIHILSDNNFNFTRVFFDFSTLQFPYTVDDKEKVNLIELQELDQLIAWGMEYDVHIQIGCFGFLGYNCQGDKEFDQLSEEEWELFNEYWCMLARRYAGIPSSYLSFDLLNEWTPNDENQYKYYAEIFGRIADNIWEIDENRVVVNSFRGNPSVEWVNLIAEQGIALGIHPYNPEFFACRDSNVEYPADAVWPLPWFGSVMEAGDALSISGAIGSGTMYIYLEGATQDAILNVYADEVLMESIDPISAVIDEYGDYREFETPYKIEIPENTKTIRLQSSDNSRWIRFDGIKFEKDGVISGIMPHDYRYFTDKATVHLAVNDSGWTNADGLTYDANSVYLTAIKPYVDIAEKYHVGVVVNELGLFGDADIGEAGCDYTEDMLNMLKENGLGWCYCEMEIGYLFDSTGTANFVMKKSPVSYVSYEYEDGEEEYFWICDDMIFVLKKFTS